MHDSQSHRATPGIGLSARRTVGWLSALASFAAACAPKPSPSAEPKNQEPAAVTIAKSAPPSSVATPPPAPALPAPAPQPAVAPPARAAVPPLQAAGAAAPAAALAGDLKAELKGLPDNVLVGTDVSPLADFLGAVSRLPSEGSYSSEQGGAIAHVRLKSGAKEASLTRDFTEPGTKKQTKRYDALQASPDGLRLSGTDLEVLGNGKSILVLEKHSGVDGIPDSLWIQYHQSASKH